MKLQIQPIAFWQETATQFEIELVQIRNFGEGGSAIVVWNLLNDSNVNLKSGNLIIKDADYSAWGSDDAYLISKVAEILNITLIEQ
jgi:hypothetical protein